MPKKDKHDLQKVWQSRIDRALKKRDEWAKHFRVQMARDYFEGKQNPGWPEDDWITINKIYSHMQAQLPSLYSIDPYFYVRLKRSYDPQPEAIAEFEKRGDIRQGYLNYLKGELELKPKARLGIQDSHFAFGVLKTHYSASQRDNPDAGKPILDDQENPLLSESGDPLLEPETIPVDEKYHWTRVHFDDFLWDEDAGPLEDDWHWVAQRIRMSPEKAKKDPRFNKAALKSAPAKREGEGAEKAGFFRSMFSRPMAGKDEEAGNPMLVAWEIYDLDNKQWLTIMEDADEPVISPGPLPPGMDCHPYSILRFTLRDESPYPMPPLAPALDPQREYNLSRSRLLRHRKRFDRKYEALIGAIDEEEIEKLEAGGDGTVVWVNQRGAVEPIKDAPLDQQGLQELGLLNNDIVEVLGTSDESRGLAGADSATQASLIDKRLEVREGDRLAIVVEWITDAARKMDMLVQAHITRDEAIKVVGPEGDFWQVVKMDDYESIAGEYEYSVNVGSMVPRLPQIERSQWLAFLQTLAQFPHLLTAPRFMKHMAELHHIEDEAMLDELQRIGQQIMGGQVPQPGGGSGGTQGEQSPVAAALGSALGDLGGIANGGGSPEAAA